MISRKELILESVYDAMDQYSIKNNGKKGICKTDLRRIILSHGGSEEDLHDAMVTALKMFISDNTVFLS